MFTIFPYIKKQPYLVLVVFGLIVWLNPDTFFWRDDWLYLSFYYQKQFALFNNHLAFEIKPLFQYFFFLEFLVMKSFMMGYQIINSLLLVGCSIYLYRVLLSFSIHKNAALFSAFLFVIHPVQFVNALWIFQQCELIHLLLLIASILYFKQYMETSTNSSLVRFGCCLFFQNYFFPNGLFYPVLFLIAYFGLKSKKSVDFKFLVLVVLILATHLAHALYIQSRLVLEGGGLSSHVKIKILYFFKIISISIWRVFIPNFSPNHSFLVTVAPLIACGFFIAIAYKMIVDKSFNQPEVHYYYSALHFPYLFMLISLLFHYYVSFEKIAFKLIAVVLIGLLIVADYKGKRAFSYRNKLNAKRMEIALKSNQYKPYDDPCFSIPHYFQLEGHSEQESAVILYRSLKKDKEQ
jgi:hypothetical protein